MDHLIRVRADHKGVGRTRGFCPTVDLPTRTGEWGFGVLWFFVVGSLVNVNVIAFRGLLDQRQLRAYKSYGHHYPGSLDRVSDQTGSDLEQDVYHEGMSNRIHTVFTD